ncbi:MAG: hypothetical protein V1856_01600 [Candidatus Liptonbacteria bacterium]
MTFREVLYGYGGSIQVLAGVLLVVAISCALWPLIDPITSEGLDWRKLSFGILGSIFMAAGIVALIEKFCAEIIRHKERGSVYYGAPLLGGVVIACAVFSLSMYHTAGAAMTIFQNKYHGYVALVGWSAAAGIASILATVRHFWTVVEWVNAEG